MGESAEEGGGREAEAGPLASSVGIYSLLHILVSCGDYLHPLDGSTLVFRLQMDSPFPIRVRLTFVDSHKGLTVVMGRY